RELLEHLGARAGEDHVDLDVALVEEALVEADIDRPDDRRRCADMTEGDVIDGPRGDAGQRQHRAADQRQGGMGAAHAGTPSVTTSEQPRHQIAPGWSMITPPAPCVAFASIAIAASKKPR